MATTLYSLQFNFELTTPNAAEYSYSCAIKNKANLVDLAKDMYEALNGVLSSFQLGDLQRQILATQLLDAMNFVEKEENLNNLTTFQTVGLLTLYTSKHTFVE